MTASRISQADSYDSLEDLGLLYDHVGGYNERHDIGFYVDEAARVDGPILELASGTGRVLIPIARTGKRIVGVDRSRQMLDRCREKVAAEPAAVRDRITLHDADMRDFDVRERFATAIIPFRPVQHLTSIDDQLSCLDAIRRHLLPGGRLVFDVFNPDLKRIASASTDEFEDTPDTPLPDGSVFRRAGRLVAAHRLAQDRSGMGDPAQPARVGVVGACRQRNIETAEQGHGVGRAHRGGRIGVDPALRGSGQAEHDIDHRVNAGACLVAAADREQARQTVQRRDQ